MKPWTVQIITDIADQSYNEMYAVMRGIAHAMTKEKVEFAPLTTVSELSICHGAFLTRLMTKHYCSPVVIYTNVAPHQTFKTDLIAKIKGKDIILMGSNNGIYDWISRDFEFDYISKITIDKPYVVNGQIIYLPGHKPPQNYDLMFDKETIHRTFGAHVIYGPIAVGLALGISYKNFGEDMDTSFIIPLDIKQGEIVHIDNYGNIKIFGELDYKPGSKLKVYQNDELLAQADYITGRMMSSPTGTFVIYPSTSLPHMVDIALVRGNAAKRLDLKIGDVLRYELVNCKSKK